MTTNIILLVCISLSILYAIYDQFGMNWLKGKTLLKVRLKKHTKIDALIFIGLIAISIYQTETQIQPFTLYLLAVAITLSIYIGFIRTPHCLFKKSGLFFENFFIQYNKIAKITYTEKGILLIVLKNNKKITIPIQNSKDMTKVINFFSDNQ
ncbi:DUF986 family protein [Seminibacterium arietis]|uniref:UPF0266 membrane protein ACFQ02_06305 n=1 Tax=Seminibacterium arietis TaxID=1173502 RepID=A0ABW3IAC2_9PAST